MKGFDPDNDPLTFGKRASHDSDVIRIENMGTNEANIYLAKPLDREVSLRLNFKLVGPKSFYFTFADSG